jgi:transposase
VTSAMTAAHVPFAMVQPRQIRDFAHASGTFAKPVASDAAVIAFSAEEGSTPVWAIAEAGPRALDELAGCCRQMIEMNLDRRKIAVLIGVSSSHRQLAPPADTESY